MRDFTKKRMVLNFILPVAIFLLLAVGIVPYLNAEYLTREHGNEIQAMQFCIRSSPNAKLKYYKVVRYEAPRRSAEIYCIYEDSEKNVRIVAEKRAGWNMLLSDRINTKNGLYWPLYL
jgi:hypothetical protein